MIFVILCYPLLSFVYLHLNITISNLPQTLHSAWHPSHPLSSHPDNYERSNPRLCRIQPWSINIVVTRFVVIVGNPQLRRPLGWVNAFSSIDRHVQRPLRWVNISFRSQPAGIHILISVAVPSSFMCQHCFYSHFHPADTSQSLPQGASCREPPSNIKSWASFSSQPRGLLAVSHLQISNHELLILATVVLTLMHLQ